MFKIENDKLKPFLVLSIVQAVFACVAFVNDLMAINHRYVGGYFPLEHKYSWLRVSLFCIVAIISIVTSCIFWVKKPVNISLPSIKSVILLAVLLTLLGGFIGYDSYSGWCCEVFPTRFFGFPFSYLMGSNRSAIPQTFDPIKMLKYHFFMYRFFLDLLFWGNFVFISVSFTSLFIRKGDFTQQRKGQGLI